ncbi:hypothetical protein LTR78_002565 [Recurvomyces mirabilis]|uniref:C2 domain-containing protein n=1 Tax=Recurvomyces mirabilis TaxID=574656 RepID=A0AAE1C4B9_9PEZI|nr:hypothetical protein LTR78_002565 [Recurvomyces mirabilis]KAK5157494.1 hypothetical protein LTS14_004259 [Recurvomyces mirabilis]
MDQQDSVRPNEKAHEHIHNNTQNTNSWPHDAEKQAKQQQEQDAPPQGKEDKKAEKKSDQPAGGYDATPLPSRSPGYTLKITIHRAHNLPMADINTFSSDPYVLAQLDCDVPMRHKEDPPLRFRTPTVRQNTEPEWNEEWVVANVPSSGFKLKLRLYDEDPADKDDRLGNVHVHVPSFNEGWTGLKEQPYEIKARSGSKRAYMIRAVAVCLHRSKHMRGDLFVSIENLGRTQQDGQNGRLYTVGPCRWFRHYDPMLGRLVNIKEPDEDDDQPKQNEAPKQDQNQQSGEGQSKKDKKVQKYNFQANQIQLEGPIPAQLYHRFVEFKPFVKRMFTSTGVQGFILGKALHHQHNRVYNFDKTTEWGHYPNGPCKEMTQKFLDLVHYDKGGRIFTYVLTLDALWRFTETGKEFGIDMLSKHTMHSDVSIYIAFSGEFFIRRLKHAHRPEPPEPVDETSQNHPPQHAENPMHPNTDLPGGPPSDEPPTDPAHYQLVIDNDSGTYRPNAKLLPLLKDFFARSLPGLHIQTLDCQKDEEKMNKMKQEQRDRKKKEGDHIVYTQGDDSSSVSSSDNEDLDRIEAGVGGSGGYEHPGGIVGQAARDQKRKQQAKWEKTKGQYGGHGHGRSGHSGDAKAGAEGSVSGVAAREAGANGV